MRVRELKRLVTGMTCCFAAALCAASPQDGASRTTAQDDIPASWTERDIRSKAFWNLRTQELPKLQSRTWVNVQHSPASFEQFRGKVILLNFWATWNKTSVRALERLKELHEMHHDDGLVIIGICNPFKAEEMTSVIERLGITWPNCVDDDKKISEAYLADGFPDFYLVDRAGKMRVIDCTDAALEDALHLLLSEPAPPPADNPTNAAAGSQSDAADTNKQVKPLNSAAKPS